MVVKPKHVGAFSCKFNVNFNNFLEQSSSAFSWIDKRLDNIKMRGRTAKKMAIQISLNIRYMKYITGHSTCYSL